MALPMQLNDEEIELILRHRMTAEERDYHVLIRANSARQKMVAEMTPEQKGIYESARAAAQAEIERMDKLTYAQQRAEQLTKQKAEIEAELATPEIADAVEGLVDGKAVIVVEK